MKAVVVIQSTHKVVHGVLPIIQRLDFRKSVCRVLLSMYLFVLINYLYWYTMLFVFITFDWSWSLTVISRQDLGSLPWTLFCVTYYIYYFTYRSWGFSGTSSLYKLYYLGSPVTLLPGSRRMNSGYAEVNSVIAWSQLWTPIKWLEKLFSKASGFHSRTSLVTTIWMRQPLSQ